MDVDAWDRLAEIQGSAVANRQRLARHLPDAPEVAGVIEALEAIILAVDDVLQPEPTNASRIRAINGGRAEASQGGLDT